jgi:hypothetical protein
MKLVITLIVIVCCLGSCQSQNCIKYADGNGNQYIITNDSLEYIPVTPEMSSSGVYSGGSYQKCTITKDDYLVIEKEINRIVNNPTIHISTRMMGTGMISIFQNEKLEKEVFVSGGDELTELEKNLKLFLNKNVKK